MASPAPSPYWCSVGAVAFRFPSSHHRCGPDGTGAGDPSQVVSEVGAAVIVRSGRRGGLCGLFDFAAITIGTHRTQLSAKAFPSVRYGAYLTPKEATSLSTCATKPSCHPRECAIVVLGWRYCARTCVCSALARPPSHIPPHWRGSAVFALANSCNRARFASMRFQRNIGINADKGFSLRGFGPGGDGGSAPGEKTPTT